MCAVAAVLGFVVFAPAGAPAGPARAVLTSVVHPLASSSSGSGSIAAGRTLFDENCSSCHGVNANGSSIAPNLLGLGSGTVQLWVSSGWMPLANPTTQPERKPSKFTPAQVVQIADYVASLRSGGFAIPSTDLKNSSVSEGFSLFALNCAPCHTITGAGDALSSGIVAPPLHGVTPVEVWEAIRTGPGNMPRFSSFELSKSQVADVDAYVTKVIEHPVNPGGVGLGGVGPVAEGFIGLFIGVGACVLIALWIGERNEREDEPAHGDGHGSGHDLEGAHV